MTRFGRDTLATFGRSALARFGRDALARFGRDALTRFGRDALARFGRDTLAGFGKSALARFWRRFWPDLGGGFGQIREGCSGRMSSLCVVFTRSRGICDASRESLHS